MKRSATATRTSFYCLAVAAATFLCVAAGVPADALGQIRVQAIHNAPYAEAAVVDVYLAGQLAADDFEFRTASEFVELPPFIPPGSTLNVDVTDAAATDNSAPIYSEQITFPAGSTIIVAVGDPLNRAGNPPFDLIPIPAIESGQTAGSLSALFVHGSPDAPAIDLVDRKSGAKLADDLSHGTFTPSYVDVAAMSYALGVSPADDTDESLLAKFLAFDASLADSAIVVLASGFVDQEPSIKFLAVLPDGSESFVAEVIDVYDARFGPDTLANFAVEGIVTRARGRITYVQQDSAAVAVFQTSGAVRDAVEAGDIAMGDTLIVSGDRSDFSSLQQISPSNFVVLSRGHTLPEPQVVDLAELAANGENYESELIRVTGLIIDPAGDATFNTSTTYDITDASDQSNAVSLRTPSSSDTDIGGVPIPSLSTFEGVVGQFSSTDPAVGYQLAPIEATDIEAQPNVGIEDNSELPADFALLDAYPNPFNPTTTISFELPTAAEVLLQVFDVLGKQVRVLESGSLPAGRHEVTFDADGLSSGIYMFRLESGDFLAAKTVVLMK
ncbi:MAG: DUF4397 domain-containing protein [Rhodothermia bacterium]|nr:DUF4397 domain-containing protein [Rhodothermia bacterium]